MAPMAPMARRRLALLAVRTGRAIGCAIGLKTYGRFGHFDHFLGHFDQFSKLTIFLLWVKMGYFELNCVNLKPRKRNKKFRKFAFYVYTAVYKNCRDDGHTVLFRFVLHLKQK